MFAHSSSKRTHTQRLTVTILCQLKSSYTIVAPFCSVHYTSFAFQWQTHRIQYHNIISVHSTTGDKTTPTTTREFNIRFPGNMNGMHAESPCQQRLFIYNLLEIFFFQTGFYITRLLCALVLFGICRQWNGDGCEYKSRGERNLLHNTNSEINMQIYVAFLT